MPSISPALFAFLRELKENNNRPWFRENKTRYEEHVKDPLLQFIRDFGAHLPEISSNYIAVPKATGGSMFRIYRDVRFSKDKSPYKTAAAVQFRHAAGKDVHAPGFYLHLEPGSVFAGCGIWHPESKVAVNIREAIVEKPDAWRAAIENDAFRNTFQLGGESLKRPPRGFDADHPLIEELKRKDFIGSVELSEALVCRDDFLDHYVNLCKAASPMMQFLTEALGLAW
ncbi:MAG: DUF2461 domain-containing protein [Anaerolineae bacterium]|jgi:uncharacterized protein (TIGR02453 family)|nr:DUF2461 domain-containing protein [Anaerolineae bacterium]MBT7189821.1 DUF2461 domain-containing protein [Anaerolineae bacterium]MBT7988679.1 DUF2461 domain-containing protein [Anaerolineae bacterium]